MAMAMATMALAHPPARRGTIIRPDQAAAMAMMALARRPARQEPLLAMANIPPGIGAIMMVIKPMGQTEMIRPVAAARLRFPSRACSA